jgi:hypothetical protein
MNFQKQLTRLPSEIFEKIAERVNCVQASYGPVILSSEGKCSHCYSIATYMIGNQLSPTYDK